MGDPTREGRLSSSLSAAAQEEESVANHHVEGRASSVALGQVAHLSLWAEVDHSILALCVLGSVHVVDNKAAGKKVKPCVVLYRICISQWWEVADSKTCSIIVVTAFFRVHGSDEVRRITDTDTKTALMAYCTKKYLGLWK